MSKPFEKKTYFAMALDPVYIGTGGYRLGRVDNTIVREPGTNLPKIPGSSIAGVTRAYTAMAVQSEDPKKMKYLRPKDADSLEIEKYSEGKAKYYSCAGKGADDGEGHCGEPDCEVCIPFGFSKGKSGSSFQGLAQFYDARILFFPVHSMRGPVWITCPSVLQNFGIDTEVGEDEFKAINKDDTQENLNFGWLMLKKDNSSKASVGFSFFDTCTVCKEIKDRVFLVSDKIFSVIVNDNLEVRTSVAIDPATGAAEDGALYTYEAIPRATIMWFDVIYNKPEYFRVNGGQEIDLSKPTGYKKCLKGVEKEEQICYIAFNVERGLAYLEYLGIGGMNTRGMGRLRIFDIGGQSNGNS